MTTKLYVKIIQEKLLNECLSKKNGITKYIYI